MTREQLDQDQSIDSNTKSKLYARLYIDEETNKENIDIYSLATSIALWVFGQSFSGRLFATFFYPENWTEDELEGTVTKTKTISLGATELGRLGGQAKSEAKTMSSRENGMKGGRPKSRESRLDIEDI